MNAAGTNDASFKRKDPVQRVMCVQGILKWAKGDCEKAGGSDCPEAVEKAVENDWAGSGRYRKDPQNPHRFFSQFFMLPYSFLSVGMCE